MTFTVIAHDSVTGQLGIGIATYSLAVGASCPFIRPGVGAVSTQAATHAPHGPNALDSLGHGASPEKALRGLGNNDPHYDFRQIGIVDSNGVVAIHTGKKTRSWAGAVSGDGWLTMGNVLAGRHVIERMAGALTQESERPLAERLVVALEAGRDAGGQADAEGKHLAERSAVVTVFSDKSFPDVDIRVDAHETAVTELRRVFDLYMQADEYYRSRSERPDITPPQDDWMRERGLG